MHVATLVLQEQAKRSEYETAVVIAVDLACTPVSIKHRGVLFINTNVPKSLSRQYRAPKVHMYIPNPVFSLHCHVGQTWGDFLTCKKWQWRLGTKLCIPLSDYVVAILIAVFARWRYGPHPHPAMAVGEGSVPTAVQHSLLCALQVSFMYL